VHRNFLVSIKHSSIEVAATPTKQETEGVVHRKGGLQAQKIKWHISGKNQNDQTPKGKPKNAGI